MADPAQAMKAAAATNREAPRIFDTLVAACAEAGNFAQALTVENWAIALLLQGETLKKDRAAKLNL